MFYKVAFTLKNLPTPYAVKDKYPPISVKFYNGTGGQNYVSDKFMFEKDVTPTFSAAPITSFGTIFSKVLFSTETQKSLSPYDTETIATLNPASLEHVTAIDMYFTPSVAIFNCSYIEYKFPTEVILPTKIVSLDQITPSFIADPWERIACESMQSLDRETLECYHKIDLIYTETKPVQTPDDQESQEEEEEDPVIDTGVLTGFKASNLVRVMYAFDGESLTWKEPPDPETIEYIIPEREIIPPWVNPDIKYIDDNLTLVDGEWVNLDEIEISGNKTLQDIDLNQDGEVPMHEVLVYFAKLADTANRLYDFKTIYRINARQTLKIRPIKDIDDYRAPGLPYMIYYEPAFYSIRFPGIDLWESSRKSVFGNSETQTFRVSIYNEEGHLQQDSDPLDIQFALDYERVHSFFYDEYVGWARCMAEVGCVELETSDKEYKSLLLFYDAFDGENWRNNANWLEGDPCIN